jgi:hypothetical protein
MTTRTLLKKIHLVASIWFVVCLGYLIAIELHQAGFRWWLVFSLSGYSAFMVLLVVSLYLFAFFHGIGRARRNESEHPLTSTNGYMGFYVSTPLLGGLATFLGTVDAPGVEVSFTHVALGTLNTTFLVWIVMDPLFGVIEMLSPTSRRCRAERLAQAKAPDPVSERTK